MPDFPLSDYLSRINYSGPLEPTPATLTAIHRQHVYAIPFENLDSFSGIPVSLAPEDLIEKIIRARRGGYCFEQNGLFLLALEALGFRTRSLSARVLVSPGNYGIRSHQVTLVDFGDGTTWFADVGFGGNGLIEAIPFEIDREFDQKQDRFHILKDETYGYRFEHRHPDGWRTLYAFSLDPFLFADYNAINYFICRSPDSIFTKVPICTRTTPDERRILVANQFKIRAADGTSITSHVKDSEEMRSILASQFGIDLPADFPLPDPRPGPPDMREL